MSLTPSRAQALAAAAASLVAALAPASVRRDVATHVRGGILRAAADKLDRQAEAHREGVHDYTDLLRVWADDPQRWEDGS